MGNDKGFLIHHIDTISFSSLLDLYKTLAIKQLLHVPKNTKILINVSKFANDNHVYFEFHSTSCFVKRPNHQNSYIQRPT